MHSTAENLGTASSFPNHLHPPRMHARNDEGRRVALGEYRRTFGPAWPEERSHRLKCSQSCPVRVRFDSRCCRPTAVFARIVPSRIGRPARAITGATNSRGASEEAVAKRCKRRCRKLADWIQGPHLLRDSTGSTRSTRSTQAICRRCNRTSRREVYGLTMQESDKRKAGFKRYNVPLDDAPKRVCVKTRAAASLAVVRGPKIT